MSDDFIPLNQSTPVHGRWQAQGQRNQNQRYQNNRFQNGHRRGSNNRWSNNSQRNNSYGSYGSDSNSSFGHDSRSSIDAYLHPSMLEDPWRHLYKTSTS